MKAKNTLPLIIGVALGIGLAASASVWSRGPDSGYQGHGMMGGHGPQAAFGCAGGQQHVADARHHHDVTTGPHAGDRKGPTGKQGDRAPKKGARTTR